MLNLSNDQLRVEILDPVCDGSLLGVRYCTGGYIWQVHDPKAGALLTGPEWPAPSPLPFNGQGLPESFRHRTRDGRRLTWRGDQGIAIGIGEIADTTSETVVVQPCIWQISGTSEALVFETSQQAAGFDYALRRTIVLSGRRLISRSRLTNRASERLELQWFAHPFFALTDRRIRVELPPGTVMADNPGFLIEQDVLAHKRKFNGQTDGHMDFLQLTAGSTTSFLLDHPVLTNMRFSASFSPFECAVWGNSVAFSIEPYQTLALPSGESQEWELRYDFGEAKIRSPTASVRTPACE